MTETVMMTLIICVTIAFCIFFICAAFSSGIKNVEKKLIESQNYITRDEFEEYEHLVSDGLNDVLRELKNKVDK